MEKYVVISLPYEQDHSFFAPLPLDEKSIIQLRRAGVHIHSDIPSTAMEKPQVNYGFVPDADVATLIRTT